MKIATTTADFEFFCKTDKERIYELYVAGFRNIDLSMYNFTPDCVYMQEGWAEEVRNLKNYAENLGMKFVQAHSIGGNPLSEDMEYTDFLLKATIRSIEICSALGIKNTVVHPGLKKGLSKEEWFEENKKFYGKLFPAMERFGVNVLCENSTKANTGDMYYINSGKDVREFIEYVAHPLFRGCWDIGHGNCEGGRQYHDIMAIGEFLNAIHYHDNHGKADEHLAPFTGTLNHDEIMHALIDVKFKGYFTLECNSALTRYDEFTGPRKRYDNDKRLSEPQLFMRRHMEKMMFETAEWMLSEYGLLEKD